jgi:hypothetical protein
MLDDFLEDTDRQTLAISAAVFALFAFGGFYLAFSANDPASSLYTSSMDVTVDSETDIATAEFDGQSIDLMHEDSQSARFYLDLDRDGSFDIELEGLTRDGETHRYNRTVTLDRTNYRLHFRYQDDAGEADDSWLELYRVVELE